MSLITQYNGGTLFNFINQATKNKISISDLNKIDLDFLEKIAHLKNIEIVESPVFIIDDKLISINKQVATLRIDTLNHLSINSSHLFYIYQIDKFYARWYEDEDKNYLKKIRKEKLQKIGL